VWLTHSVEPYKMVLARAAVSSDILLRDNLPEMTKIIIAQRISSIKDCNRILVLDDGKMAGFDTHDNLLKSCKIYQEICAIQEAAGGDFDKPQDDRKEAQS
jgi:ABC-type transport system involved in cytochrome bd biosynthesis fused ATPase/permease subunit